MKQLGRRSVTGLAVRAALVPAAVFAVHQLRYVLAYGSAAGAELADTGHSYLHSLVPWIVLLIGLAAGGFLWALGRAFTDRRSLSRHTASFAVLWLACVTCLVAIYGIQEFLEGLFATGHPTGLVGIFGYGGWWAVPAAAGVGLVLAAIFHGARWALEEVARRASTANAGGPPVTVAPLRPGDAVLVRVSPLAEGWSGRGPPR